MSCAPQTTEDLRVEMDLESGDEGDDQSPMNSRAGSVASVGYMAEDSDKEFDGDGIESEIEASLKRMGNVRKKKANSKLLFKDMLGVDGVAAIENR